MFLHVCLKNLNVVLSLVALVPEVVLVSLLCHGDEHDEEERERPARRRDRGVGKDQGQDQRRQEVEVGSAPELLEKVPESERQES